MNWEAAVWTTVAIVLIVTIAKKGVRSYLAWIWWRSRPWK